MFCGIILVLVVISFGYFILVTDARNKKYEEIMEFYQKWYVIFQHTLNNADRQMKDVDIRGSFEADDEVGFAYQTIKSCMKSLIDMEIDYGQTIREEKEKKSKE